MTPAPDSQTSTKDRILDVAERLFAELGFDATSLRTITSIASVNLAAVNYHFKSKEALLQAVFERRAAPVNRRRLQLLDDYLATLGSAKPEPEPILDAFFRPIVELRMEGSPVPKLMVRLFYFESGDNFQKIFEDQFRPMLQRFIAAFHASMPHLPPQERFWRMQFVIGAFAHVMNGTQAFQILTDGRIQPSLDKTMKQLIHFASAGLRAPANEESPCTLSSHSS